MQSTDQPVNANYGAVPFLGLVRCFKIAGVGGVSPDRGKLASEGLRRSGEPSSQGDDRGSRPCWSPTEVAASEASGDPRESDPTEGENGGAWECFGDRRKSSGSAPGGHSTHGLR